MKKVIQFTLSICFLIGFCFTAQAQEEKLSPTFKKAAIENLSKLMNDFYIFPEVAKTTSEHLNKQLAAGHFDQFETLASFSEALTTEAQSINKDKHLVIRPSRPMEAKENTTERMFEEHLHRLAYDRSSAGGFKEAKKLEGNIGYFDIRNFASSRIGGKYADSYMQLLSTSDAIIIDLRKNGGGDPAMVQYLCSYFFDKKVHLNSLYYREGDRTEDFWTLDKVAGEKMPDIPLFVLTSEKTFSGAEEFSYNMQTQKRATLVGATTGGGANPVRFMRINEEIEVYMPIGKAINPITKTNWEGVGVIPEVKTAPEDALANAHELAKVAAEKYRESLQQKQKALSKDLVNSLASFDAKTGADTVYESLKKCTEADLIGEGMINGMGYEYLMNFQKPVIAEAIFRANTMLFPESANVYDSYAETLAASGQLKAAAENYQKAIDLAKKNNDGDLKLFMENLEKVKARMD